MTQNRSSAVMAQRKEPSDSLDFFPTPLWATRALMAHVIGARERGNIAWDPACGQGHMFRALRDYFPHVIATDVHDYGWGRITHDFLMPFLPHSIGGSKIDWIITNPPFRLGEEFVHRALALGVNAAMLVRLQFLESVGRYEDLFRFYPPAIVAQFVERVPMFKGRLSRTSSTATAYAWLIWRHRITETRFIWIPPCRARLERPGDWDDFESPYDKPLQDRTS